MDRDDDVERLFSWIKTPELHYREFAAEREVADAAASWPAPRDAVTEPSHPGEPAEPEAPAEAEPAPSGRPSLGERLTSLFAHREPPPEQAVVRAPPPPPVADLPRAQPAPRAQTPPRAQEDVAAEVPWTPEPPPQAFARLEPAPPAAPPRPAPMPPVAPPQPAP